MNHEQIATYRLQLRPGFGFDDAARLVPYLKEIGVSHLYLSPCLQAVSGSTHGYDVVDPTRVNEELGGAAAHERLCLELKAGGLGQMLDIVSNHMAVAGRQNPWWWDVLENGPSSRYATCFDVDWEASEERWPNKMLLPVLGDHYGRILEDGQIRLSHREGVFALHYQEHVFPVDPSSLTLLLGRAADASGSELLAFLAESHARMPRPTVTARQLVERRHRDKAVLALLLERLCREEPEANQAIEEDVARLNREPDALDEFIDQQNYRLAFWRTASRDLGYRRFFDIKDLAALRVEDMEVFSATHALPVEWIRKGWVHGLRIDHPDGLRDPGEYFHRLLEACPDAWIVAEKILEPGENLPPEWPIAGTTGYDFLNLLGGLFVDPEGEEPLNRLYEDFTAETIDFKTLVRTCKRLVLRELLGSELNRLASLFVTICERHRRQRDYTRHDLYETLCETAVCFPVYRSYISAGRKRCTEDDERHIAMAVEGAVEERPDLDPELFRFLEGLLLLRVTGSLEEELAMRFQQLTGPAMAKGVEDTAFYRYNRLVALNEVGGDPGQFGKTLEQFHQACIEAQAERPLALLASTTHDTKRSEDVRARLSLLSEMPARWADTVRRWAARNQRYRREGIPDRNTEYLLYQTLIGAWPIDAERTTAYMEKAVREAKAHTSWTQPDEAYEQGLRDFIRALMEDREFLDELERFVASLLAPGRTNSLAQTLIRLTAPGVPDIYQGTELWDLSLVDPDNRRPVDFAMRRNLLDELSRYPPGDILKRPGEILKKTEQGLPKLWVIRQVLRFRRLRSELFGPRGSYRPLYAAGSRAGHVVAFIRGEEAITVTPRLVARLNNDWADTVLELPPGKWRNLLTGELFAGGTVSMQELLALFPVAFFVPEDSKQ